MTLPNPYTPMLLTYNPRLFFGRENEITSILQLITASEPGSHAIYGTRTIGKTHLLRFLKDKSGALKRYENFVSIEYRIGGERRLLFIYINFHNYPEINNIFYVLLEQLDLDLQTDDASNDIQIPQYDEATTRQDCFNLLRRTLIKLDQQRVRVVFLLDDFDIPLPNINPDDDGLLRTLSDYAALIIATEEPISELRPDIGETSPLLGILRPKAIGLITEQASRDLICTPAGEVGIEFTDDEEDLLLHVAGRQPFLLTAACELYFETRSEFPDISQRVRETTKRQIVQTQFLSRLSNQLHVISVLQSTWVRLKPEEHRILHTIVVSVKVDISGEPEKIAVQLANKGLIYWDFKHNVYRIFSLLFSEFVRRNYAVGAEITHIKPPELKQISDNLTPIDRSLLNYLVQHADVTCTFEELLDAVWEDGEKSKRALEAAVHRIRKVLGPEEQVKNVRGIGYKYVSTRATLAKHRIR
jgi:hypothetical protein